MTSVEHGIPAVAVLEPVSALAEDCRLPQGFSPTLVVPAQWRLGHGSIFPVTHTHAAHLLLSSEGEVRTGSFYEQRIQ